VDDLSVASDGMAASGGHLDETDHEGPDDDQSAADVQCDFVNR
jgi:hypothetical protein